MNLENFPTSESAKRMIGYVTPGFYERSYVGKWIYQVMGMEMDNARCLFDELQLQISPETATWGVKYHEQKYGITINPALSLEERRREVVRRRDFHAPMNPARVEGIVKGITHVEVKITENIADYTFAIDLDTTTNSEQLNYSDIVRTVKKIKPSHLSFYVYFSSKSHVNVGIKSVVIPKWPHMAGEEFCGVIPDSSYVGKVTTKNIKAKGIDNNYKIQFEVTGTKPFINTVFSGNAAAVIQELHNRVINTQTLNTGDAPAGAIPAVNCEIAECEGILTSHIDNLNVKTINVVSGEENTGIKPGAVFKLRPIDAEISKEIEAKATTVVYRNAGEEIAKGTLSNQGIGAETEGKAVSVVYTMCGEEGGM